MISILEVMESAGYKPTLNKQDALWLLSQVSNFEDLVTAAEDLIEAEDE